MYYSFPSIFNFVLFFSEFWDESDVSFRSPFSSHINTPEVYYRIHHSPKLDAIPRQNNSAHIDLVYCFQPVLLHFNVCRSCVDSPGTSECVTHENA
jgi:hypothetical protein